WVRTPASNKTNNAGVKVTAQHEKPLRGMRRGFSRGGLIDKWLAQAGRGSACPICTLSAKAVEFPIAGAAQKRTPLAWGEPEHWARWVLAVADTDPAIGQASDLDAVAVAVTKRTLDPRQTCV